MDLTDWERDPSIMDRSSRWVHRAVVNEMPNAIARALRSGAQPPLTYVGAGAYGIVLCDQQGMAFKVARHGTPAIVRNLREEAEWFAFAQELPDLKQHVARLYGFDDANGVLIRECVPTEDEPSHGGGKRDKRRWDLYTRITGRMRDFGFRSTEFKEDAFVYAPRRGLVLVDAGFGKRDIGWANARRARQLLQGAEPTHANEPSEVLHGLKMDAGKELPKDIALKLADELEAQMAIEVTVPSWAGAFDRRPLYQPNSKRGRRMVRDFNAPYLEESKYSELRDMLLHLGGEEVVLREEPDLDAILVLGRQWPAKGAKQHRMAARSCHTNAARLWAASDGNIKVVTGWALSADGYWRQHSWGWDGDRVWETTEKRTAYFGFVLSPQHATIFAQNNA